MAPSALRSSWTRSGSGDAGVLADVLPALARVLGEVEASFHQMGTEDAPSAQAGLGGGIQLANTEDAKTSAGIRRWVVDVM